MANKDRLSIDAYSKKAICEDCMEMLVTVNKYKIKAEKKRFQEFGFSEN
jgi:RNase P subunit RPR2